MYPVGHHIAIRNLLVRDDTMFIYNEPDVLKITSMSVSKDLTLVLTCEMKENSSSICIYNLSKLSFNNVIIFKPKRKVVSTIYSEFIYSSFSWDGNYIASLGVVKNTNVLHLVVWDIQIFQPFKDENYKVKFHNNKPKCYFEMPGDVTKISFEPEENKVLCTSGNNHICFWHIFENSVKPFKQIRGLNINNNNFVDHGNHHLI